MQVGSPTGSPDDGVSDLLHLGPGTFRCRSCRRPRCFIKYLKNDQRQLPLDGRRARARKSANPPSVTERLTRIATQLRNGERPEPVTVRELLSWFGAQRRGSIIAFMIREELDAAGLTTNPDFYVPYIDAPIEFQLSKADAGKSAAPPASEAVECQGEGPNPQDRLETPRPLVSDPTYRIGRLRWVNIVPTSVFAQPEYNRGNNNYVGERLFAVARYGGGA